MATKHEKGTDALVIKEESGELLKVLLVTVTAVEWTAHGQNAKFSVRVKYLDDDDRSDEATSRSHNGMAMILICDQLSDNTIETVGTFHHYQITQWQLFILHYYQITQWQLLAHHYR